MLEPIADYTHAFDHVASLGTFVKLDLRRRGLARKLFEATFRAEREKGYEKLFTFVRNWAKITWSIHRGEIV